MLESISFWAMYGLLTYICYVGLFTVAIGVICCWIYNVTDGDYCTKEWWSKTLRKWLPVDNDMSSDGAVPILCVLISIVLGIAVNFAIPQSSKDFDTGHQVLVALSEGLIGVGYFIAICFVLGFSTCYINAGYRKVKAFKAKLDKVK